jgi:gas vesicle protein
MYLVNNALPAHASVFVAPLSRPQTIVDLREQLASFQQLYEETVTEMQGEVQKSMADASEIQKKLVEAHDAAMKQLKDYAVSRAQN